MRTILLGFECYEAGFHVKRRCHHCRKDPNDFKNDKDLHRKSLGHCASLRMDSCYVKNRHVTPTNFGAASLWVSLAVITALLRTEPW